MRYLASRNHELGHDAKLDVETRARQDVKAVVEDVLEEEMAEHVKSGNRDFSPAKRGERKGYYQRNLLTPTS